MKKLIVDCDTGVDDAQALIMAITAPDTEVLAITCVAGNATLEQAIQNSLRIVTMWNRLDIPIYKGAPLPLLERDYQRFVPAHGNDGLGDVPHLGPTVDAGRLTEEHAVMAMTRLAREHRGEITLVCLGPLTNAALAIKMDPEFGSNLKDAVFMGGNVEGQGNNSMSLCGEFNFTVDSEAAHLVFKSILCPIKLVPWETCIRNFISIDKYNMVLNTDTDKGRFYKAITAKPLAMIIAADMGGYWTCDPLAMLVALDETAVTESITKYCTVELQGEYTRGMVCVDWRSRWHEKEREPNVMIVKKLDMDKLCDRFVKMLL